MSWLVVKIDLSTWDRLAIWGYMGDFLCLFYRGELKCMDHLYFKCSFTRRYQLELLKLCLCKNQLISWDDITCGVQDLNEKILKDYNS